MGINLDKPQLWKSDINLSVDLYNTWFMEFAPKAFRETRISTTHSVEQALGNKLFEQHFAGGSSKAPRSIADFENVNLSAYCKR